MQARSPKHDNHCKVIVMSEFIQAREPDPSAAFCRRNGIEFPEYLSLGEVRADMDLIEPQLVDVLAEHKTAMDMPKMVNLKNELPLVRIADIRLEQIGRLQALARPLNPGLEGFEDLVEDMHRVIVTTDEVVRYDFRRSPKREQRLVGLLADRCRLVRQAAFFKRDFDESSAPQRQARNIANARSLASNYEGMEGFEDYVAGVYGVLVPSSVALQHRFLRQTQPAAYRHRVRGISALLIDRQDDMILGLPDESAVKEFVRQKIA